MVAVEKITPSMFPDIYQTFLADDDPHSTEADWRRLFFYDWRNDEDPAGYALVDRGKVVGVLGTVFSQRHVAGKTVRFCNLHTWNVKEDYRGRSLFLMRPALGLRDHVLTDFTPTPRVVEISQRLGFVKLDCTPKILLPSLRQDERGDVEICRQPDAIANHLNDTDLRLLHDHKSSGCGHLLATDNQQYCYVIYSRVSRRWLPYCYVHYVSHPEMFARYSLSLRRELKRLTGARYVAIDARRLDGLRVPASVNCPVRVHSLFRGPKLNPAQIDTLYSEVLTLKLCTFPSLKHTLRRFAQRLGMGRLFGEHTKTAE